MLSKLVIKLYLLGWWRFLRTVLLSSSWLLSPFHLIVSNILTFNTSDLKYVSFKVVILFQPPVTK